MGPPIQGRGDMHPKSPDHRTSRRWVHIPFALDGRPHPHESPAPAGLVEPRLAGLVWLGFQSHVRSGPHCSSWPSMQCSILKSSMPFICNLALQIIPLSKQPFKMQPQNWKWRCHLKSSIYYARHKNQQASGIVNIRGRVRWLILNSSHCLGNMYHVIHAQV